MLDDVGQAFLKGAVEDQLRFTRELSYIWLEGRVCRGVFTNWVKHIRYKPHRFFRPTTEQEIVKLIGDSRSVRVFGSAAFLQHRGSVGPYPDVPR